MIEELVKEWFVILAYCDDKANFDAKFFKMKHDNWASRYKRMSLIEQGEVNHFIAERLNQNLPSKHHPPQESDLPQVPVADPGP